MTTQEDLRTHYGAVNPLALRKQIGRLDQHCRAFIALSPFVVVSSAGADGRCDATPRGDAPGFVAVVDDATLILPDRPGNRRIDTMLNVAENPHVGLLFMVPGLQETLRVNGSARFTTDAALLEPLSAQGKPPVAGLIVDVEEVYFHCGKAIIRSKLWADDHKIDRSAFPSLGRIIADQVPGVDAAASDAAITEAYRSRLY
jgi:PPOX class probable FMN-dependent enzyme